jgi:N-acetyl-beta-hexosaminidase
VQQIVHERITATLSAQMCYIEDSSRFHWRFVLLEISHQSFETKSITLLIKIKEDK